MDKPVYPFSAVLKALRADAGLTVLQAAEATHYPKYERWESGRTRVGAQHLQAIADAFNVGEELYLLLFAWLADRMTPRPGQAPAEITGQNVERFLSVAPSRVVALDEYGHLVVGPATHAELAALALVARYDRPENSERHTVWLAPVRRSRVRESVSASSRSVLDNLYSEVMRDASEYVGRTLMTIGSDLSLEGFRKVPLPTLAGMLSRPEAFEAMAEEGWKLPLDGSRELDKFAVMALRQGDEVADLSRQFQAQLRALLEAVTGEAASDNDIESLIACLVSGDLEPIATLATKALDKGVTLAGPDTAFGERLMAVWEALSSGVTQAIRDDMAAEVNRADPMLALEALQYLRSHRADGTESGAS
jgi:transcriptional regulator with XRE-family HTH domain